MSRPVLLAVDGNALLHRNYHALAHRGYRLADGRPAWAVQGLLEHLAIAVDQLRPQELIVGFDDPDASVRRERWPAYKAQRRPVPATLRVQVDVAREVLTQLRVRVVVPPGLEADDVLASAVAQARRQGRRTVLLTSDRDLFAVVRDDTQVWFLGDQGVRRSPILTAAALQQLIGVRPDQYADLAALRGDPSDNLPGVPGVGPVTAARLLGEFGSAAALFADVAAGGQRLSRVVGPALARRLTDPSAARSWAAARDVMAMREDVPLGSVPPAVGSALPLPQPVVRQVYQQMGVGVGVALRALGAPAESSARDEHAVESLVAGRAAQPRPARRARFSPLRTLAPAYLQEPLF